MRTIKVIYNNLSVFTSNEYPQIENFVFWGQLKSFLINLGYPSNIEGIIPKEGITFNSEDDKLPQGDFVVNVLKIVSKAGKQ